MMDAAAKVELIKKISALPEPMPHEADERIAEMYRLLAEIEGIVNRMQNWQTTVEAMEAARRGELKTYGTVEEMFAALHADN